MNDKYIAQIAKELTDCLDWIGCKNHVQLMQMLH